MFRLQAVQVLLGSLGELNPGLLVHGNKLDLFGEFVDRLNIEILDPGIGPELGLLGGDFDNPLQVVRQLVPGILVEEQAALNRWLMNARFDDILGNVVKTHRVVDGRCRELGGIDNTTLESEVNFTARQW